MELIPAIDLQKGRCVRLERGDFDAVTHYAQSPIDLAVRYRLLGARWLHIVDLDGARDGRPHNMPLLRRLAELGGVKVQIGGGIRHRALIARLLDTGVARVVVGSAAISDPATTAEWLTEYSPERIVLALDVRIDAAGTPWILSHGWTRTTRLSLWQGLERFAALGVEHVLCTDVERDGMMSQPNFELYRDCTMRFPTVRFQASGGVASADDVTRLNETGVAATVAGKALLAGQLNAEELRRFWQSA